MAGALIGQEFGGWRVVGGPDLRPPTGLRYWFCKCVCGNWLWVYESSLRLGKSRSCGCLNPGPPVKHGRARTLLYATWKAMRQRCSNPKNQEYHRYGGRGIRVCERWQDFQHFLADMGERPAGMTLDRVDNDGHYEPSNVRWATPKEQCQTRRKPIRTRWSPL